MKPSLFHDDFIADPSAFTWTDRFFILTGLTVMEALCMMITASLVILAAAYAGSLVCLTPEGLARFGYGCCACGASGIGVGVLVRIFGRG